MAAAKDTTKEPLIDWEPSPGYLLIKVLKREEVAEKLYSKKTNGPTLSLPDHMGKVSDGVGVGQVLKLGGYEPESLKLASELGKQLGPEVVKLIKKEGVPSRFIEDQVMPGDYVAFMPYTDLIMEIDGLKYSLLPYSAVRGVRKGQSDVR